MSFERNIRWISALIKPTELIELKLKFRNKINSKRKYSQINNFCDLVGVLMARGIMGPDDVSVLNQICQEYLSISFNDIPDSLLTIKPAGVQQKQHDQPLVPSSNGLTGHSNLNIKKGNPEYNSVSPSGRNVINTDVIECIAGKIGERQWRPFVRSLRVETTTALSESTIADKVRKAISTFLQNTEPNRQWPLLELALEQIHRIDLREECRELLSSQM